MRDALAETMVIGASKAVEILSRIADTRLQKTAGAYKAALAESVTATATSLKIELTGLAEDLEKGYPARDMKQALLASPNAKISPKGVRYVDVPFVHLQTQNTRYQGLPVEIKARIQASVRAERVSAKQQGRDMRNPLRVTGRMAATDPKHSTSIYSDMIKSQAGSTKTYSTIRRISDNSDRKLWHHPGFSGIHAIRQAKSEIARLLQYIFKRELSKTGLKTK